MQPDKSPEKRTQIGGWNWKSMRVQGKGQKCVGKGRA